MPLKDYTKLYDRVELSLDDKAKLSEQLGLSFMQQVATDLKGQHENNEYNIERQVMPQLGMHSGLIDDCIRYDDLNSKLEEIRVKKLELARLMMEAQKIIQLYSIT